MTDREINSHEASIPEQLEATLKTNGVDILRFKRDLALEMAQHHHATPTQERTEFVLTEKIITELIKRQTIMMQRGSLTNFIRNERVFEANQQHHATRKKAFEAAQKAKSYTGDFDSITPSEQEKALAALKQAQNHSTLGMTPLHHTIKVISDIISRLKEQADGKTYAQEIIKSIALDFQKEEQRVINKEIDILQYIENCKKIIQGQASELIKPQTIPEAIKDFLFHSLRAIFSILHQLFAWAMSQQKSLNNQPQQRPYIPEPKTVLATELETILSEFPALKEDVTKQLDVASKQDKKYTDRKARVLAAKAGTHPMQAKYPIQAAIQKQEERKAREEIEAQRLANETPREKNVRLRNEKLNKEKEQARQKEIKHQKWISQRQKREQKLTELVATLVKKEIGQSMFVQKERNSLLDETTMQSTLTPST